MRWLRSILRFPLTRIVIAAAIVIGVPFLGAGLLGWAWAQKAGAGSKIPSLVLLIPVLLLTHLTYVGYVRLFERRPASELYFRKAPAELLGGALLGALMLLLVVGPLAILGYYRVLGVNNPAVMVAPVAAAVFAAYREELVARGVLFRILEEWLGTWLALSISAAIFGGLHLLNRNATLLGGLGIALSAGLLLGAAFVITRRLWMPIGLHFCLERRPRCDPGAVGLRRRGEGSAAFGAGRSGTAHGRSVRAGGLDPGDDSRARVCHGAAGASVPTASCRSSCLAPGRDSHAAGSAG